VCCVVALVALDSTVTDPAVAKPAVVEGQLGQLHAFPEVAARLLVGGLCAGLIDTTRSNLPIYIYIQVSLFGNIISY
jgi:hypothetical protein